jgi:hypothetical protein
MTTVHIRDLQTDEIVHTIEAKYPSGSGQFDHFLDGLYLRVDLERYYIEVPE